MGKQNMKKAFDILRNRKIPAVTLLLTAFFFSSCSVDTDDIIFSDAELEFIKTLAAPDSMPDDPTSDYDTVAAAATLGQQFWWDTRFSGEINNVTNSLYNGGGAASEGQINCSTCHNPSTAWVDRASRPDQTSLGSNWTPRHTPTVANTVGQDFHGWDGRLDSPWSMAIAPIEAGAVANFGRLSVAKVVCDNYSTDYDAVFTDHTLAASGICTAVDTAKADCEASSLIDAFEAEFTVTANYLGVDGTLAATDDMTVASADNTVTYRDSGGNDDIIKDASLCTTAELAQSVQDTAAVDTLCVDVGGTKVYGKPGQECFDGTTSTLSDTNRTDINRVMANWGKAVAAYERLLVDKNSSFDKWVKGKSGHGFSTDAKNGLRLFIGKGNCIACHNTWRFADGSFHNIGVPQHGFAAIDDTGRQKGISTVLNGTFNSESEFSDKTTTGLLDGLVDDTDTNADWEGAFKTPTLRSIAKTAPYMHTGSIDSLWDVLEFYNFGGASDGFPGSKDPAMIERHLSNQEMHYIVAFLNSLTGEDLDSALTTAPTLP